MKLVETNYDNSETGCCARLDAEHQYVADRGLKSEKTYFYYATCPKRAKHYGKNNVVLFAQVD